MEKQKRMAALRVTLSYAVVAAIWIVASDRVLAYFQLETNGFWQFSTIKGLLFVLVTGTLLFITTHRELRVQQEKEQAAHESDEKFRLLFERSGDANFLLDGSVMIDCNESALRLFRSGQKDDFLLNPFFLLSPEFQPDGGRSAERWVEWMQKAIQDGSCRFEWQYLRMNGKSFPADVRLTVIYQHRKNILFAGVRDLTELKRSESNLQAVFESSQTSFILLDPDMRVLTFNPLADIRAHSTFQIGITPGSSLKEFLPADMHEEIDKRFQEVLTGKVGYSQKQIQTPTGEVWFELTFSPVKSETGQVVGACFSAVDITEQKQIEAELRQSWNRLDRLVETVPSGILFVSLDGETLFANPAAEKILGVDRKEIHEFTFTNPNREITSVDGRRLAVEELPISKVIQSQETVTGIELSFETSQGDRKILRTNAAPLLGANQKLNGIVVSFDDITEQKLAEEALREREEQYRLLFQNTPGGIFHYNNSLQITDFNSRLLDILGSKAEKVLGLDLNTLVDNSILPALQASLRGENGLYEGRYRSTTGTGVVWISLRTAPVYNRNREITGGVGITEDITGRIEAEANVQRQVNRLADLHDIDYAISENAELPRVLDQVLDVVVRHLRVDAAAVARFDPSTISRRYMTSRGLPRSLHGKISSLEMGYGAGVVAARQILHIHRDQTLNDILGPVEGIGNETFQEYFGVPLLVKGQVYGVLELFNRTPRVLDADEQGFLETLAGQAAIAMEKADLFEGLQQSNRELLSAYDSTIEGWSRALDLRDRETEGHSIRVTEMTLQLAKEMGVDPAEMIHIRWGALLHDIGKLGVPDSILQKPGPLTEVEWKVMRDHPVNAYRLLSPISHLKKALDIPYYHHEYWDGSGYPSGAKGKDIPLSARTFAVVDVWDALSNDRPYRKAWPKEQILTYIRERCGTQFDPEVLKSFLRMLERAA
jgi:PAS domain S-box-containing protein/putative nucleotidyltransferase with HDIG domain